MKDAPLRTDNPGVVFPPPLIFVSVFLFSLLLEIIFPIGTDFLKGSAVKITGSLFIAGCFLLGLPALVRFYKGRTALFPHKAASSLQTTGIYSFSRNPMYLGLLFFYLGLGLLAGNWWTLILAPLFAVILNSYVIAREEQYLERAFGVEYLQYKQNVRRWI